VTAKHAAQVLLLFAATALSFSGCRARVAAKPNPPPPVAEPMPNLLEAGQEHLDAKKFGEAASDFESYLSQNPNAENRDLALFKLGLCLALGGKNPQDQQKAQNQFRLLVTQYPRSQYYPVASMVISLQASIERLGIDLRERNNAIAARDSALSEKDEQIHTLTEENKIKSSQPRGRTSKVRESGLRERDEKIKELNDAVRRLSEELDRIKKIDLQRNPSKPPG
jgi:outer membrane protein assembly factor BamD (BamD/ComL family)